VATKRLIILKVSEKGSSSKVDEPKISLMIDDQVCRLPILKCKN